MGKILKKTGKKYKEKNSVNKKIRRTLGDKNGELGDIRYYNVTAHRNWLIVAMIAVAVFALIVIPLVMWGFQQIDIVLSALFTSERDVLEKFESLIPDFFGGMVGILVGFGMEWLIFGKLKILSKYKSLLLPLNRELCNIHSMFGRGSGDDEGIRIIVTDDIVLNANNSEVFFSLPQYTPFNKNKGVIYSLLVRIYSEAIDYNATIDDYREQEILEEKLKSELKELLKTPNKNSEEIGRLKEDIEDLWDRRKKNAGERARLKQELKKYIDAFLLATTGNRAAATTENENRDKNKNAPSDKSSKYCLLKAYRMDKSTRDDFIGKFKDSLLRYGESGIKKIITAASYSETEKRMNDKYKFIYSQRHMGTTCLFKAIQDVWSGNAGEEYYNDNFGRVNRPCIYISLKDNNTVISKDPLCADFNMIFDEMIKDYRKGKGGSEIENLIVEKITAAINKRVGVNNKKTLLLLDDMDTYLSDIIFPRVKPKIVNGLAQKETIWFYRKCWLKSIIKINRENADKLAIIVGLHTNLAEYKEKNDDNGYISALDLDCRDNDRLPICNLSEMYMENKMIEKFSDACFGSIPKNKCKHLCACENGDKSHMCKFSLREEDFDKGTQESAQRAVSKQYEICKNNPWWIIGPLTHAFEGSDECDEIDSVVKGYYDNILNDRKRGNIVAEFFKDYPLYINKDIDVDRLERFISEYEDQIISKANSASVKDLKDLKVKFKKPYNSSNENILAKQIVSVGGLGEYIRDDGKRDDGKFRIHPFVAYVYSDEINFNTQG